MTSLIHTKCFNHGQREAVARCPACKRHYCRECVTEHDHRLLCASCIVGLQTDAPPERMRILYQAPLQFIAALVLLWVTFYVMGQALMRIPSTYHDNQETVFQEIQNENTPDDEAAVSDGGSTPS